MDGGGRDALPGAWLEVAAIWSLLLLGRALAPFLAAPLDPAVGAERATTLAFSAALAVALAARPAAPARAALALPGFVLGGLAFVPLAAATASLGLALGLAPPAAGAAPGAATLVARLALAPLFEELVYRERLLPALAGHVGRAAAVGLSTALFALPHAEPWSALACLVSGPLLAALFLTTRSVAACAGAHAGLNAAGLLAARVAT